jgi:acyl carrier protein
VTVHERLQEIVQQLFGDDTIKLTDYSTWSDISGWDSLVHVNLIFSIENAFGIRFSDDELGDLKTIGDFERMLAEKAQTTH